MFRFSRCIHSVLTTTIVLGRSWFWGLKKLGYPVIHIADVEDQDTPINIAARLYSLLGDDMVSVVLLDYYNQLSEKGEN
jgi:hypothetical protein